MVIFIGPYDPLFKIFILVDSKKHDKIYTYSCVLYSYNNTLIYTIP